ncbi:inactive serine/threonine-kinase, putative [Actinidia rufa]|uniref:Inactive serine/threonine-kinase, putative n=1 Tax=Actinidia rufa TaxID=165716 RepID=A0A7J0EW56_9ERIC|nr:inactive serine/threonine-kinase, putative [Actinidia rufa]
MNKKIDKTLAPNGKFIVKSIPIIPCIRKKTCLHLRVAQSEDQEHEGQHKGVSGINKADPKLSQIFPSLSLIPFVVIIVEDVQALKGGYTIVELAIAVSKIVSEGGEKISNGTKSDERYSEVLVSKVGKCRCFENESVEA